jgi:hypothetical protein
LLLEGGSEMIKRIISGIFSDIVDEIWTLVGLFAGWLVLTGSAKTVIGQVIMYAFIIWLIRNRIKDFRKDK